MTMTDEESAFEAAAHWLRTGESINSVRQRLTRWTSLDWHEREGIVAKALALVKGTA